MPRLVEKFSMWFDYPDDPDGGKVEIQSLSDQDIAAIRAKAQITRVVLDAEKGPMQEHTFNIEADRRETIERVVLGWENFYDEDLNPMACTPATRQKWSSNSDFVAFVNRSLVVVNAEARKRTAERRKN